jgi:hypothetical protein
MLTANAGNVRYNTYKLPIPSYIWIFNGTLTVVGLLLLLPMTTNCYFCSRFISIFFSNVIIVLLPLQLRQGYVDVQSKKEDDALLSTGCSSSLASHTCSTCVKEVDVNCDLFYLMLWLSSIPSIFIQVSIPSYHLKRLVARDPDGDV